MPRAFFVNDIKVITEKNAIFQFMKSGNFDPTKTAILEHEPETAIQPDSANRVNLVSSSIHDLKFKASVAAPALMVLSEIYYPAGWNAYVDGVKTEIHKTNYILRSIFLQPGDHEIEFKFEPTSFKTGLLISLITLFGLIAALFIGIKRNKKQLLSK